MHTILVKVVRDQVVRAEYFESKFDKISRKIKKTEDEAIEQDVQDQAMIERAQQSNDYERMVDQGHLSL